MVIKMNRIEKRIDLLYALRRERFNDILEKYCLTYEDYLLISAIHYMEGSSIEELKKESGLNSYSIRMILNDLISKNYVLIEDNKIYLSDNIKKLYPQIRKRVKKEDTHLIEKMNKEEVSQILDSLEKLIDYYEK